MAIKQYITSGIFTKTNVVPSGTPTQVALFDGRQVKAAIQKEVKSEDIMGAVDGSDQLQVLDTIIQSTTYKFTPEIEAVDSDTLALMFGEMWESTSNFVDQGNFKRVIVPATPFTIVDTALADGLTAADVQVSIIDNGVWGLKRPLEVITGAGTPTAEQVKLDTSTTSLIFHSSHAGAVVKYVAKKTHTTIETLGVNASYRSLDSLQFVGHLASTRKEKIICIVDLTPAGGWELPIGDKVSVKLEFKCNIQGANRSPVRFARIAA